MVDLCDDMCDQESYLWGVTPSLICFEVLKMMPPDRPGKVLVIGCDEGRNAVFFARSGYEVINWRIEHRTEEVLDCKSGGMPHQHAVNRMVARRPAE